IESFASREVSFMFNSVILLGTCFAVLWGTMLPALSEWLTGEKITVHEPWFNRVIPPMAIALLFLTGAGLLLDWRKTSSGRLKRNFVPPATIAIAAGAVLYFRGIRHFYALSSLGTAIFVGLIIVREFYG